MVLNHTNLINTNQNHNKQPPQNTCFKGYLNIQEITNASKSIEQRKHFSSIDKTVN